MAALRQAQQPHMPSNLLFMLPLSTFPCAQIFYHVLHKPCSVDGSGLFVDVGGNFGWFSVFSATLGCSVIAFEPVPQFRAFFEYNLARNGLEDKVQVRHQRGVGRPLARARPPTDGRHTATARQPQARPATAQLPRPCPARPRDRQIRPTVAVAQPGKDNVTVVVPQRGIWGTAGIDGANLDELIDNEGDYERVQVSGERVDDVGGDGGVGGGACAAGGAATPLALVGRGRLAGQGAPHRHWVRGLLNNTPNPRSLVGCQVVGDRHVDLMKVDVEGFEPDVLQVGARAHSRPVGPCAACLAAWASPPAGPVP